MRLLRGCSELAVGPRHELTATRGLRPSPCCRAERCKPRHSSPPAGCRIHRSAGKASRPNDPGALNVMCRNDLSRLPHARCFERYGCWAVRGAAAGRLGRNGRPSLSATPVAPSNGYGGRNANLDGSRAGRARPVVRRPVREYVGTRFSKDLRCPRLTVGSERLAAPGGRRARPPRMERAPPAPPSNGENLPHPCDFVALGRGRILHLIS